MNKTMLCLVASPRDDQNAEQLGRLIGTRLTRAAKARGWTQGQVHYQANQGQPREIVSSATVSALLRGAIANPGIATVLAVAKALDLSIDQVLGVEEMPLTEATQPEGDVTARLARLERMMRVVLEKGADDREALAEALEAAPAVPLRKIAGGARRSGAARKAR